MTKQGIYHTIAHYAQARAPQQKDRLQFIVLCVSIVMYTIGLSMHFTMYVGTAARAMQWLSAAFLTFNVAILVVTLRSKIKAEVLFSIFGIVAQIVQTMRMFYLATAQPESYADALMLNEIIAFTIIIFQVIALTRHTPLIVTFINIIPLCFVALHTPEAMPRQLVIIFAFEELFVCAMGYLMQRFVFNIQHDNDNYQKTQQGILAAFGMTQQELVAYLQLCRSKNPKDQELVDFISQLDERAEENLIRAVEKRKAERMLEIENFASLCPTLTPTELEVCRLVVAGKTLSEIARIMDKNTNNISSVRIHIRKKLALKPSDDLRMVLTAHIKQSRI